MRVFFRLVLLLIKDNVFTRAARSLNSFHSSGIILVLLCVCYQRTLMNVLQMMIKVTVILPARIALDPSLAHVIVDTF